MYNDEENICRLCLTKSQFTHGKNEDVEPNKIYLEKLCLQMNLSVSERPIMCCMCSRKLRNAYEFKSSCLVIEERIKAYSVKSNRDTVDLREFYSNEIAKNNIVFDEMQGVCRFCLGYVKNSAGISLDIAKENITIVKDVLPKFLPELDFSIASNSVVCLTCIKLMQRYFGFWKSCREVEEKIDIYCQNLGMNLAWEARRIKLTDVIGFIAKNLMGNSHPQVTDTKIVYIVDDSNSSSSPVLMKTEMVKNLMGNGHPQVTDTEIIHIVDDSNSPSSPVLMKTEMVKNLMGNSHPQVTDTKIIYIVDDSTSSKSPVLMKTEMVDEVVVEETIVDMDIKDGVDFIKMEEEVAIKCEEKHIITEQGDNESFEDKQPIPVTTPNPQPSQEFEDNPVEIKNENKSKKKTPKGKYIRIRHRCTECNFQSRFKRCLTLHMRKHSKKKTYGCDECKFTTIDKSDLEAHNLIHRECTEHKSPLNSRIATGDKPTFICHICGYETIHKSRLKEHIHNHETRGTLYKCVLCPFESRMGRQFKKHMKDHPKAVTKKVRCPQDLVIIKEGDKLTLVHKDGGDSGAGNN